MRENGGVDFVIPPPFLLDLELTGFNMCKCFQSLAIEKFL
jgi:hypothetical protein